MSPLLIVIVTFGLFFVVLASLGQGFGMTIEEFRDALGAHAELNVMLLISKFLALPVLLIGLAALIDFHSQVKMGIIVLALTARAPFIPLLVAQGKGDATYGVFASFGLLLVSLVVVPLALPPLLRALNTGASPSVWLVT